MGKLLLPASRERLVPSCGGPGWLLKSLSFLKMNRLGHLDRVAIECGLYPAIRLSLVIALDGTWSRYRSYGPDSISIESFQLFCRASGNRLATITAQPLKMRP